MKKILLPLLCLLVFLPDRGQDPSELHPVEVFCLIRQGDTFLLETDTGLRGMGTTPEKALQDLKRHACAEVFADTARILLVDGDAEAQVPQLYPLLRPGCKVYAVEGTGDLTRAAEFLRTRDSGPSLLDHRAGATHLPTLYIVEGEMTLAP